MADLLISDIDADLRDWLTERARANGRSVSGEAAYVLQAEMNRLAPGWSFARDLFALVEDRDRGDDLNFDFPELLNWSTDPDLFGDDEA